MKSLALPFPVVGSVLKQKLDNAGHVPAANGSERLQKAPGPRQAGRCHLCSVCRGARPLRHVTGGGDGTDCLAEASDEASRGGGSGGGGGGGGGDGAGGPLISHQTRTHVTRNHTTTTTYRRRHAHVSNTTHTSERRSFRSKRGSPEHRNTAPLKKLSGAD